VLAGGRVYTLAWDEPRGDGAPAAGAPCDPARGCRPDAEAVAIRGNRIVFVGTAAAAKPYVGPDTRTIQLPPEAAVLPGLVDAHVHAAELGASLERVNLVGVQTEADAVARVAERARTVPKGEWIVGWGWDEGAWANRYPDAALLSQRVPDHPVFLRGLHSFAAWGNRLALERAGITASTAAPDGGEIRKDAAGRPTGILLNNAVRLLEGAVPAPTTAQLKGRLLAGLRAIAAAGFVTVHEAGAGSAEMQALEELAAARRLPIRVYAMLAAREPALLERWRTRGPDRDPERMLVTRSVKAFSDGALGSRGARLLDDYSDRPGHRGEPAARYGFDAALMTDMIRAGFQVAIHAIGDAANRETLDFLETAGRGTANAGRLRHRIEHAQVLAADDVPRFARLNAIASMQPSHATEDMAWAEARVGPARVRGGYAWRSLRRSGARLLFSSDLPGTGYDIFYGLHSAITRRDRERRPPGGWFREQAMTPEEAIRGYTTWAAYAAFREAHTGTLAPGRWADVTVLSLDPFTVGASSPDRLLSGAALFTIVGGRIVHGTGGPP
jgi:predicted amidohydrolase YtcJ